MNRTLIILSGISFLQSTAMLPPKMKEHIEKHKRGKSIEFLVYSVKLSQDKTIEWSTVQAITLGVKAAIGEQDYMGDVVQTSGNDKYLTLFMLGDETKVKERLRDKWWFNSDDLITDILVSNADLDNK